MDLTPWFTGDTKAQEVAGYHDGYADGLKGGSRDNTDIDTPYNRGYCKGYGDAMQVSQPPSPPPSTPDIPMGWRQMDPFEIVLNTDLCWFGGRWESPHAAVGGMAVNYPYYVFIRFNGLGTSYLTRQKKYRSIDDV